MDNKNISKNLLKNKNCETCRYKDRIHDGYCAYPKDTSIIWPKAENTNYPKNKLPKKNTCKEWKRRLTRGEWFIKK